MNEKEKKALRTQISANSHEVYVISLEEMDNIVAGTHSPKKRIITDTWGKLKGSLEFSANYGVAEKRYCHAIKAHRRSRWHLHQSLCQTLRG